VFRVASIFLFVIFFPASPYPQSSAPASPSRVQAEDGGTHQVLESIVIPPQANAPFVATLHTEWVRGEAGNGTITLVNDRQIARDSAGRIYQQRWLLVPRNAKAKSKMNAVQFSDPGEHTLYTCMMLDPKKICRLTTYLPSTSTVYSIEGPPAGPSRNGDGYTTREDLGHRWIVGVDTVGTRVNTTLKPGAFGNDQELTLVREFWFASQLGIDLLSTRSDPRFGTQTFSITDINQSEPDPHLFDLPEGFTIIDQRQTAPPESTEPRWSQPPR
jgi:hypothetical protein